MASIGIVIADMIKRQVLHYELGRSGHFVVSAASLEQLRPLLKRGRKKIALDALLIDGDLTAKLPEWQKANGNQNAAAINLEEFEQQTGRTRTRRASANMADPIFIEKLNTAIKAANKRHDRQP